MINNIENNLTEQDLNQVTGGYLDVGEYRYDGHVGMYDGVRGVCYYFIEDDNHYNVKYGELIDSYEETYHAFWSKRVHIFREISTNKIISVYGDDWTMYTVRCKR